MNRNVPLLPTAIFLLLIACAIWLYASKVEDISPTVVQQVVKDTEGTTWALFGDTLIDIADEKANRRFSHHGFDHHVGQIIPRASGEWILNVGAQSDYVKKAMLRSVLKRDAEYQSSGSLLKCSATLEKCLPWGEVELQFERAFDGVELDNGNLLLFKAEQKRIFLVDTNGIILDEVEGEELWFGAEPIARNEWVGLNTERENLTRLQINQNKILVETLSFDLYDLSEDAEGLTLVGLSKVIVYNGKFWCLANVFNRLDKLSLDSKDISRKEALMENLDDMTPTLIKFDPELGQVTPMSFRLNAAAEIQRIDDAIYFSDFFKHEVKRFDLTTETMSSVESTHLQTAFQQDAQKVGAAKSSLYQRVGFIGLGALAAFIWLAVKSTPIKKDDDENSLSKDVLAYGLSDDALNREFVHVAKTLAKTKLTKMQAAAVRSFKYIDGNYIYYPHGVFAKGRVVPDVETLVRLFKWEQRSSRSAGVWLFVTFICFGLVFALTGVVHPLISFAIMVLSLLVFVIGLVVIPIISAFRRRKMMQDLLEHNSRLGFYDILESTAKQTSPKMVWGVTLVGVVLCSIALFLFVTPLVSAKFIDFRLLPLYSLLLGILYLVWGLMLRRVKLKLTQR